MRRVLIIFLVLVLLSAGAIWLAQEPGDLVVHWRGYEIRTSFVVGAGIIALLAGGLVYLWQMTRRLFRSPRDLYAFIAVRRERKGYLALTKGMVAVAAGDAREARLRAAQAERLLGRPPLTMLLSAQAAQLEGDSEGAKRHFAAMLEDKDTSVIGHRGLFIQAQRAGDPVAALFHARAAQEEAPRTGWAGDAVFQLETYEGDWDGALKTLDKMVSGGLVPRDKARRRRAVLLTAKAREIVAEAREDMSESGKARRTEALNTVSEAVEMEPAFTPAVTLAARLLGAEGKTRKATRLIERAWASHPHPELLDTFLTVHRDESAFERHRHVQALAAQNPEHKESRIALAKGAIGSRDWEAARAALGHFLEGSAEGEPSVRICELMAEIEDGQFGNRGRAREWLSRALHAPRDEAWVSDGYVSQDWLPVCPRTGAFDAFEWKVPQSMIVPVASTPSAAAPLPAEREKTGCEETGSEAETAPAEAVPSEKEPARPAAVMPQPGAQKKDEADILPPAPDDPGPGADEEDEEAGVKWVRPLGD